MDFTGVYASMTPGSQYKTYVPTTVSAAFLVDLQRALTIAGFMEIQQLPLSTTTPQTAAPTQQQQQQTATTATESCYVIQATRPAFEQGASFSIIGRMKNKKLSATTPSSTTTHGSDRIPPTNGAAKASDGAGEAGTATAEEDDDLIDEDTLLDELDKSKPTLASLQPKESCETKPKACKNCSCGRAEMEIEDAKAKSAGLTQPVKVVPTSSCGNCSLGDAFRCGGCPYRGTPAFKPGEQVILPADMMADDL